MSISDEALVRSGQVADAEFAAALPRSSGTKRRENISTRGCSSPTRNR
jgi:hypothetical protein